VKVGKGIRKRKMLYGGAPVKVGKRTRKGDVGAPVKVGKGIRKGKMLRQCPCKGRKEY
jgi:hypothetical protein